MKVVVDTNVLVSGLLNPAGKPGYIVQMVLRGDIEIVVDDRILAEYSRVLRCSRLPIAASEANALLGYITHLGLHVSAAPLSVDLPDPSDLPFLEVAQAAGAEALVTGNLRHFPGVTLAVSPADFLARWRV
jgi:uncharacterized protein